MEQQEPELQPLEARGLGQGKGGVGWYHTQLRDQAWEAETEEQPAQNANVCRRDIVLKVFNMDHVDSSRIGGDFSQMSLLGKEPQEHRSSRLNLGSVSMEAPGLLNTGGQALSKPAL